MKVGDLVRLRRERFPRKKSSDCGIWEWKVGLIVGRDKRSDLMKSGKDGDFYYMSYYKVLVDGKVIRVEKGEMEKLNNG